MMQVTPDDTRKSFFVIWNLGLIVVRVKVHVVIKLYSLRICGICGLISCCAATGGYVGGNLEWNSTLLLIVKVVVEDAYCICQNDVSTLFQEVCLLYTDQNGTWKIRCKANVAGLIYTKVCFLAILDKLDGFWNPNGFPLFFFGKVYNQPYIPAKATSKFKLII